MRAVELALVLGVSVVVSLYQSLSIFLSATFYPAAAAAVHPDSRYAGASWTAYIIKEAAALGVCVYVLFRQGRSLRAIGLRWKSTDLPLALGLTVLSQTAAYAVQLFFWYGGFFAGAQAGLHRTAINGIFTGGVGLGILCFNVLNAFYEELIVRAYLMSEVAFLTGSMGWAVAVSTVLQAAYHLYLGWPSALCTGAGFLVFSIFYARTRRIAPVILAHMIYDFYVVYYYAHYY